MYEGDENLTNLEKNPADLASNFENSEKPQEENKVETEVKEEPKTEAKKEEEKKADYFWQRVDYKGAGKFWKETFTDWRKFLKWLFFSFIWLFVLLFVIDLVSKLCAQEFLTYRTPVVLIPGFLQLTLTYNTGMAFGMGGNTTLSRVLLALVSWIALIVLLFIIIFYSHKQDGFIRATLMVLLAGDLGNLIDRTFYETGVIDFIDVTPAISWMGIFNIADSCLVVGILMLIGYFIYSWIKEAIEEHKSKQPTK